MTTYVTRNAVFVERLVFAAFASISYLLLVNCNHVSSHVLVLCSCVIAFITLFLALVSWRWRGVFFFGNWLHLVFLDDNIFNLALICNCATLDMLFTSHVIVAANAHDLAILASVDSPLMGCHVELEVGLVVAAGALEP